MVTLVSKRQLPPKFAKTTEWGCKGGSRMLLKRDWGEPKLPTSLVDQQESPCMGKMCLKGEGKQGVLRSSFCGLNEQVRFDGHPFIKLNFRSGKRHTEKKWIKNRRAIES